jgi:hypothetical protein
MLHFLLAIIVFKYYLLQLAIVIQFTENLLLYRSASFRFKMIGL